MAPGLVRTAQGLLRGTADGAVQVFQGVPYAAPPVGERRWQPPVPPACWDGERAAAAFGPSCPRLDPAGGVGGQEDCLTLNVWTPSSPRPTGGHPVLFFLHGGGNTGGSSSQPIYDGRALAERGAVVVTANYRLGALGFLTHPALDAESPRGVSGNYGILDQLAALDWVQRNVAALGGDPRRVLIFGESAGGTDVCVLVASPLARGLFSTALVQSGGCAQPPLATAQQADAAVVERLGCADAGDVPACLRARPPADLVATRPAAALPGSGGQFRYRPNVDGYLLEGSPVDVIRAGRHNVVPLVVGTNSDEMAVLLPGPVPSETAYQAAMRGLLDPATGAAVLARYPAAAYADPTRALVAATTDARFTCPARTVARAAAAHGPVYRYFFTHALDHGPGRARGAFHGLELGFVFGTLGAVGGYEPSTAERALSGAMIGYWTRLAATGDPNGEGAAAWPRYDAATDPYLQLDVPIAPGAGVRSAHCDFWDTVSPALVR